MAHIVVCEARVYVRVEGSQIESAWIGDEELKPVEVMEVDEVGETQEIVADEFTAKDHPAAVVALAGEFGIVRPNA